MVNFSRIPTKVLQVRVQHIKGRFSTISDKRRSNGEKIGKTKKVSGHTITLKHFLLTV